MKVKYLKIKDTRISQLLDEKYGIKNPKITLIKRGVSNTNYIIVTNKAQYILRVCRFAVKNQVTNSVQFMFLEHGLSYCLPKVIPTIDGKLTTAYQQNPTFLMTLVPGKEVEARNVMNKQIKSLGESLAELHKLKCNFSEISYTLTHEHVFNAYDEYVMKLVDRVNESEVIDSYISLMQKQHDILVNKIPKIIKRLPRGVVHNDLTAENVLFVGEKVSSIVDWEEVGDGILIFDIARAINAWFFSNGKFQIESIKSFINAYQKIRVFTNYEKDQLETALIYEAFIHAIYNAKVFTNDISAIDTLASYNVKVLSALGDGFKVENVL